MISDDLHQKHLADIEKLKAMGFSFEITYASYWVRYRGEFLFGGFSHTERELGWRRKKIDLRKRTEEALFETRKSEEYKRALLKGRRHESG